MRIGKEAICATPWKTPLVLVVEPDPKLRTRICVDLRRGGTDALGLEDGEELIEYVDDAEDGLSARPDAIVAGVARPEAKVVEACEQLLCEGAAIPVILIRPDPDLDLYDTIRQMGAAYVLDQPVDPRGLKAVINDLTLVG
jgi:DNA-binding response OmpR family regulator